MGKILDYSEIQGEMNNLSVELDSRIEYARVCKKNINAFITETDNTLTGQAYEAAKEYFQGTITLLINNYISCCQSAKIVCKLLPMRFVAIIGTSEGTVINFDAIYNKILNLEQQNRNYNREILNIEDRIKSLELIDNVISVAVLYAIIASYYAKISYNKLQIKKYDRLLEKAEKFESESYKIFDGVNQKFDTLIQSIGKLEKITISDESNYIVSKPTDWEKVEKELKNGVTIFGSDIIKDVGAIFGSTGGTSYLAKIVNDNITASIGNTSTTESRSIEGGSKFTSFNDTTKDRLENKGLREKRGGDSYYDVKNKKWIEKADAPTFYEREITLAEYGKSKVAEASLVDFTYDNGDTNINVKVGDAEAHADWAAGFYVLDSEGNKQFSPGVHGEVGASVTVFEAEWEQQWLGDENLGLNTNLGVTAGKAEAKLEGDFQIYDENGKLDAQLGIGASAEAIAGEIEGSLGVNVLGGEIGVKGSLNYGIGAHADVGFKDGVFKFDVGATFGVGASVAMEVDVGGMVDTVVDGAKAAWDWVSGIF